MANCNEEYEAREQSEKLTEALELIATMQAVNESLTADFVKRGKEIVRLRAALEQIKSDCENCDWKCDVCWHGEQHMKETDIYHCAVEALKPPADRGRDD